MSNLPQVNHVAIIMDGNGRWATRHGVERSAGHRAGAQALESLLPAIHEFGIHYLTLYAFSTENWKRSSEEVDALMKLLEEFATSHLESLMGTNVRLNVIGRIDDLPRSARMAIKRAIENTRKNTAGTLTLALNYGGRAELVDAAKKIAAAVKSGSLKPADITEENFKNYLYDPELPDPELLIRTSGELRLSNFLLWELAYTEIYVTNTLWPDFDKEELRKALEAFGQRDRRFGGRKK